MRVKQPSVESLIAAEDVLRRIPLLKRVSHDVIACYDARRKAKERLEELVVISKQFSSCEIQETINNLRRRVNEYDRDMDAYDREVRLLGGILRDARRGLVYFYSEREGRRIFLVWDPAHPDTVSWHELDASFADRTPIELARDRKASAIDVQD
jgi:hypothetical protein